MTSCFVIFLELMPKFHHRTLAVSVLAATAVGCAVVPEDPVAQMVTGVPAKAMTASGDDAQFPLGAGSLGDSTGSTSTPPTGWPWPGSTGAGAAAPGVGT